MAVVHASRGFLEPHRRTSSASPRSSPASRRHAPETKVDWDGFRRRLRRIREHIERVFPAFADFNPRVREPGGFHLHIAASRTRVADAERQGELHRVRRLDCDTRAAQSEALMLATIRSHDQYNTTIYGFNDRYRGINGRRDVIFMHKDDLQARGLSHGDLVDVEAIAGK